MRVKWQLALVLVILGVLVAQAATAEPPLKQATSIIKFVPSETVKTTKEGNCWTSSIAVPRQDAWRCMVGNEIFDPCFASSSGKVLCDPNPAKGESGFSLKLTEPLPQPDNPAEGGRGETKGGWLVELVDGTLCRPSTGASGTVGGKTARYYCESKESGKDTVLLGDLNSKGAQWTAEKATVGFGLRGTKLFKSEKLGVKTVWQ